MNYFEAALVVSYSCFWSVHMLVQRRGNASPEWIKVKFWPNDLTDIKCHTKKCVMEIILSP